MTDPLAPITIKKVSGERESDTMLCRHAASISMPNTHTPQTRLSHVSSDKTEAKLKRGLKDKQGLREPASQQGRLRSAQLTKTA